MKSLRLILAALVTAAAVPLRAAAPTASSARPNVVLIMPDDLSWADFSAFDPKGPRTPNIDALVSTSVRLTDFHVSPTCSPTRAALMTGRYNDATGAWHTILGRSFLRADEITMADIFKANGYRTALFGKWHLGDSYPFRPRDRGFEHTAAIRGGGIDQQPNPWGNRNLPPATLFVDDRPVPLTDEDDGIPGAFSTDFFTTRALDYIRERTARSEPFFAYLAYNVAHGPQDRPADARAGTNDHTATVENLDKNIGRVLRHLDAAGLAANTLVVFLTDNGMANDQFRAGKASHYEGGHRVPCVIRWPQGGLAGTAATSCDVPNLTSHVDLLPTFIDLLGLSDLAARRPPVPLHGVTLRGLLQPGATGATAALRTRILTVDNQRMDSLTAYRQASVMGDELNATGDLIHKWRLVSKAQPKTWELYDLVGDKKQVRDLAAEPASAATVARFSAAYEKWWAEISARAGEYCRPILGSDAEPATCLYSEDWHTGDNVPWNHTQIAEGMKANGFHAVEFARSSPYIFDLRRWPREIEAETTATSALAHPIQATGGNRPTVGIALPIRSARLRIW